MSIKKRVLGLISAAVLAVSVAPNINLASQYVSAAEDVSNTMDWGAVEIGGGGFVSGIITGQNEMIARTDVGGAYKYNYDTDRWEQLVAFINYADRGFLSVSGVAIDPTDDDTFYMLCGCAYFSGARTVIFRTRDGGKTFDEIDVTDMIQVHGNGDGRQCGEPIAIDPENPDVIYCGGDVTAGDSALIMSKDGGDTWESVKGYDDLGFFKYTVNWPFWDTHPVRAATTSAEQGYNQQNGVGTIAIEDGKVYVGTSIKGETNVHVADVGKDNFKELSADLPTANYPSRISKDVNGNLFITYIAGLAFNGSAGGAYKYDTKTGTVTDISPTKNGYGAIYSDPKNPDHLVATTCGLWYSQMWQAWSDDVGPAWGDRFFKSTDGGKSWISMTPGNTTGWGGPLEAEYLQDGGRSWIRNKAIHWVGAIVIDPRDTDKIFVTSGNGTFACDNTWDECPQFYFHPDGIEEVVALDMISIPGGNPFSAIGDYDGFEHASVTESGKQHYPNMGSTSSIAYCPQNPDVMVRIAEHQGDNGSAYYTLDGGDNWVSMKASAGGKAYITQLADGKYRIFKGSSDSGSISYTDNFGETWSTSEGIPSAYGSKPTYMLVEPDKPNVVYAYATYYNSSWFYSKPEPTIDDAHYSFCVSTDYGKTFTSTNVAMYDQCDSAARIAYLGEDNLILGAGYYGLYNVTNGGKTVKKIDSVYYCKTVGYGAPEKAGDVNTLYMYGKPQETDPEGIYRSQDSGNTWVLINKDKLYGGTGNGNFLVGDMNEFGKVYMSTVGCGIVYGELSDTPKPPVTTAVTTTKTPTTSTTIITTVTTTITDTTDDGTLPSDVKATRYGDVNVDTDVNIADIVKLNMYLLNNTLNPITPTGYANANCVYDTKVDTADSTLIMNYVAMMISEDKLGPQN